MPKPALVQAEQFIRPQTANDNHAIQSSTAPINFGSLQELNAKREEALQRAVLP